MRKSYVRQLIQTGENPLLVAFHEVVKLGWEGRFIHREHLVKQYSWAVPTPEAIQLLVELSPIVEIGAGTGYWASLVTAAGGDVAAFDRALEENRYHPEAVWYHPIWRADHTKVIEFPDRTLFLCWPPYDDPMAHDALQAYGGKTLVYVGEGDGGCTGDDAFFERLQREWTLVKYLSLPQWPGIRDGLCVYQRKI